MVHVSGAFVTRWHEEMAAAERMGRKSSREVLELFLTAMQFDIARVFFPEATSEIKRRTQVPAPNAAGQYGDGRTPFRVP